ncbi:MAG: sulfatase-like hydrolase/transferase, partial [Variovorax sp.]
HVDLEVGRVLAAMHECGAADDTLVIFTSDHGDMLGDHALLAKGAMLYDPCVRVPLIAYHSGHVQGGQVATGLAQLHDVAATALHAAGAAPEEITGWMPTARNLAVAAAQPDAEIRPFAICAYRNSGIDVRGAYWDPPIDATMVRRAQHKLHRYHAVPGRQEAPIACLFDLARDPLELHDLAHEPHMQDVLAQLQADCDHWQADAMSLA